MSECRLMTLEEVENCDVAYLVYEPEDIASHQFVRVKTCDTYIQFERSIGLHMKSQPMLRKQAYCVCWFAFTGRPRKCVIDYYGRKIADYIRREQPWLLKVD